ncbi:SDR family NAD(P)-dependent oxidoreductase [Streptococcus macedonicus]|uniref:SDR family NAD(P)-dependent oxidoreductase n=1 Tax=Streptococcus macedonicus TaxID=59310 RepID=UPI0027DB1C1C|nr:SDR family NAD(P)-dependent oxidoreductase [Streptococcus macedonicus]
MVLGDRSIDNAKAIAKILTEAGFDVVTFEMDLSSRQSIKEMIAYAQTFGDIKYLVNDAGVSSLQASIETVLKVDFYGTSVLLEEIAAVITHVAFYAGWPKGWAVFNLAKEV